MARKPIEPQAPMTPAARRRKSDADKAARGELRLTSWISKEAAYALYKLTGGSDERGVIKAAVEQALIAAAESIPSTVPDRAARRAAK